MGITANSGPFVGFGITQTSSGLTQEYNEERGPSVFDLGICMMDPRPQFNYKPGNAIGSQVKAFFNDAGKVDYIPYAISSAAISQSSATVPTANTALTLVPLSTLGAFQTTIIAPESGIATSVIAIDSTASVLVFGQSGTVAVWNPAGGAGRVVSVTHTSCLDCVTGNVYTILGRDVYGFKMQETIVPSTVTATGTGRKAFKYIQSIIAATTIGSTGVGIGFGDTFGLPIKFPYNTIDLNLGVSTGYQSIVNTVSATSSNTITASTAVTQTASMPDVRGTWTSSIATTGTSATIATGAAVRIQIRQRITPQMVSAVTASDQTSIFGAAQYSTF